MKIGLINGISQVSGTLYIFLHSFSLCTLDHLLLRILKFADSSASSKLVLNTASEFSIFVIPLFNSRMFIWLSFFNNFYFFTDILT